eukprot:7658144-Pyramimonas_sp.AAC.1
MSPNAHEIHDLDALTPGEIQAPYSFAEAKQLIQRDERRIRQESDGTSEDFRGRTKRSAFD